MDFISILFLSIALAMDAFSVSITKGFTQKDLTLIQTLWYGLFFGGFQALMPLFGYLCGSTISYYVSFFAPIIGFILLLIIGLNMIRESLNNEEEDISDKFSFKEVTVLAIATSIDAFAVGLTFAFLNTSPLPPSIIIGVVALIFSILGIFIGKKLGNIFGDKFEIIGGIILIIIGIKILIGF